MGSSQSGGLLHIELGSTGFVCVRVCVRVCACVCVSCRDAVVSLPDYTLPAPDAVVTDTLSTPVSVTYGAPCCRVQLLGVHGSACVGSGTGTGVRVESVAGRGQLSGGLQGLAVVHKRQSWASAVQELKVTDTCTHTHTHTHVSLFLSWP